MYHSNGLPSGGGGKGSAGWNRYFTCKIFALWDIKVAINLTVLEQGGIVVVPVYVCMYSVVWCIGYNIVYIQ